jgi:hypothetical protein
VGSLSIPMMLIQTPGSFVWAGSLAARLGVEGWSTWGVFLVTGCLQGCLLFMGIYFEVQARKGKQNTEGEGVSAIQKSTFDKENANYLQANVPSIVGYNPDQREADDEGGVNVENELNERTPLLNGSRK